MRDLDELRAAVRREAEALHGEKWQSWMRRRNRRLAQLTPEELMETGAGAQVVLLELQRTKGSPRAA